MTRALNPTVRYSLLRLGLFLACAAVVWVVFALLDITGSGSGILIVGIALALSGVISFKVLGRHRDEVSAQLYARVERAKARIDDDASAEDEALDAGR